MASNDPNYEFNAPRQFDFSSAIDEHGRIKEDEPGETEVEKYFGKELAITAKTHANNNIIHNNSFPAVVQFGFAFNCQLLLPPGFQDLKYL